MESSLRLLSITVISYKILPEQQGGYVKLYVNVEGKTRFMHPLSLHMNPSPVFKFSTRYSELLCLHLELKELYPALELPAFPKKKWIGSRSESFIAKRIQQLNDYFAAILQIAEVNPSEPLMRLISPHRPLKICVIGGPRVGKQYLVELFVKNESSNYPVDSHTKVSMCSIEIAKSTPIDLLIEDKLFRIACLDIKTFTGNEGQEKAFVNEIIADKHAAVVMYKEKGTSGHAAAHKIYDILKPRIPCILANCDTESRAGEFMIRTSRDAFLAFEALIRIFKSD